MSHRVTTETEIKDKACLDKALKAFNKAGAAGKGLEYTQKGNILTFTSGKLKNATLDLSTGQMAGDTDNQSEADLGSLRQVYALEKVKADIVRRGGSVKSVITAKDGTIKVRAVVNV